MMRLHWTTYSNRIRVMLTCLLLQSPCSTQLFKDLTFALLLMEPVVSYLSEDQLFTNFMVFISFLGSGKSHTMNGTEQDLGLVPKCIEFLINSKPKCNLEIRCSMFEIYNEVFNDLLYDGTAPSKISIQLQNAITGDKIERVGNVAEILIDSLEQFNELSALAYKRRKVAATHRNNQSSRSHAILQFKLNGISEDKRFESYLLLLDLAGVECSDDHLSADQNRLKEMMKINTSIFAFGSMIENLRKGCQVIDFRSSKLTRLLKPYITSNSKTLIIATAAQDTKYLATSKNSLSLASSARKISLKNVKKNVAN